MQNLLIYILFFELSTRITLLHTTFGTFKPVNWIHKIFFYVHCSLQLLLQSFTDSLTNKELSKTIKAPAVFHILSIVITSQKAMSCKVACKKSIPIKFFLSFVLYNWARTKQSIVTLALLCNYRNLPT